MRQRRPYGSWPSPISAADVATAGRKFADLEIDEAATGTPELYWIESRPEQAGRNTIMRQSAGAAPYSLLDTPMSARSAVHEYGGGAFTVHAGIVWFVNAEDQAIWRRTPDGHLRRVTEAGDHTSYADLQYDARHDRLIAVAETARDDAEPVATIETIDAEGHRRVVAKGHDFHASPRLSPAGDRLVWLAWNHPDMPWDATELWQALLDADGGIGAPVCRWAPGNASLFGPLFDPDGRLYIVCDADNWWNIYREDVQTDTGFEQLTHEAAEFGVPQWVFGQNTCAFTRDGTLYALATRDGVWQLGRVDRVDGSFNPLSLALDFFEQLHALGDTLVVVAADAASARHILAVSPDGPPRVLRESGGPGPIARLSRPEAVSWPTADNQVAHGLFYAPASHDYAGPADERPPLILKCHGGPTGATATALDARIQFWTSRGYAVLDVNYRGSTGYGRAYRQQLIGAWGVADVADCVHGAAYLGQRGDIDASRVLISGSSAGGYTVLCVLTFTDLAAAGASYYGIGDLRRLMASTHKFESRYLQRLIGADDALLQARSPLAHAEQLSCPVLFLQGLKDKVVPPDQARTMVEALRGRGIPVAHVTFEQERHGFRDAANIEYAIAAEQDFYRQVLGLPGDRDSVSLTIDNFEARDMPQ